MSLYNNVFGYWKLDESSGSKLIDSIQGNTGTAYLGYQRTTGIINGGIKLSANTTGPVETNYLDLGAVGQYQWNQPFSISMWYKRNSTTLIPNTGSSNPSIQTLYDSKGIYLQFYGDPPFNNRLIFGIASDRSIQYSTAVPCSTSVGKHVAVFFDAESYFNDTDWHHIVCTSNGSGCFTGLEIYIDGVNISTTRYSDKLNQPIMYSNTDKFIVGNTKDFKQNPLDAIVDEIGMWSTELSSSDVTELYNGGSGTQLESTTPVLSGTYDSDDQTMDLSWVDNNGTVIEFELYRKVNDGAFQLYDTITYPTKTYTDTGVSPSNYYFYKVRTNIDNITLTDFSNIVWTKKLDSLCLCGASPNRMTFCYWNDNYNDLISITGATCGNDDGVIELYNTNLFEFFDMVLVDYTGGTSTFNYYFGITGSTAAQATGLTAGYYELQITTKNEYESIYGDGCVIQYIPVNSISGTITPTTIVRKPIICGPFDKQSGRVIWNYVNSNTGSTYTYYVYETTVNPQTLWFNTPNSIVQSGDTYTGNFIFASVDNDAKKYYAVVIDNTNGCVALFGPDSSGTESVKSVPGIKRLFITPYNEDLDYNYWKTSDEDFYIESEDASFFISTKIKRIFSKANDAILWYEIPVKGTMSLGQEMGKPRQGILLQDTINVEVPKMTIEHYDDITDLLGNKFVGIVEDNMGQVWIFGYEVGATVDAYVGETGIQGEGENKYSFVFNAVSSDKILTAVDRAWYNDNIFGQPIAPINVAVTDTQKTTASISWTLESELSQYQTVQLYSGGTWHSIANVASTIRAYTFTGLTTNTSYDFRVANYYDGENYFSSSVSTTTLYGLGDLLEHYYNFDNNVLDTVGNYDLSLGGKTSYVGDSVLGQAIQFSGESQSSVWRMDSAEITLPNTATVSIWVNPDDPLVPPSGFTTQDVFNTDLTYNKLRLSNNIANWVYKRQPDDFITSIGFDSGITADTYQHMVITWNGATIKTYFNGVLKRTQTDRAEESIDVRLAIGYYVYGFVGQENYYTGRVDEVGIWSRSLTPTEITELYNNGNGRTFP